MVAAILLVAISVLGGVIFAVWPKGNGGMILLTATTARANITGEQLMSKSGVKAGREGYKPSSVAHSLVNRLERAGEWRTIRMRVTGYCPCSRCCGEYSDGVTASGHKIRSGDAFVAAEARYPFGSEMIIPGYNNSEPVKVLDRGGAICGGRLDVFFASHQEALRWGVRYLDVQVRVR